MTDTVVDAVRLLSVNAAHKGLELVCAVDPTVPPQLLGDPGRVRQIVINLVGNAIKFTERGEVVVRVTCQQQSDRDTTLHLTVQDTGIGIPADRQQAIFEAFRQSDSSMTRRYGGTGLGLAICAELVRLMNGRIWVESTPGQGSCFHVEVTLRRAAETPLPVPAPTTAPPVHVMLFAANETARDTYRKILQYHGLVVESIEKQEELHAADGSSAFRRVLVVDVSSRDAGELKLLRTLQSEGRLDHLPVVALLPAGKVDTAANASNWAWCSA